MLFEILFYFKEKRISILVKFKRFILKNFLLVMIYSKHFHCKYKCPLSKLSVPLKKTISNSLVLSLNKASNFVMC